MNTAIVTDSNSGITTSEARELRVFLVPMPFFIGGELYYEGRTLTHAEFFRRQREGAEISTSQPTPGDVMSVWDEALKEHDELVYIPMSSSLSGACDVRVEAAYSCSAEEADDWAREIRERFGERFDGYIAPLSLSIACHTGPGAFGVGCVKGADY